MSNSTQRCTVGHSVSLVMSKVASTTKTAFFFLLFTVAYFNLNAQLPCNPPLLRPHIDGNPCEWPGLLSNINFSSGFEHDVFNVSTSSDDQYTQGSADPNPISTWVWNLGNTNNKTDIANAGSFMKNLGTEANPENHLYFFGDRTSLNGDANFGFWFFRNAVGLKPKTGSTSTFIGNHTLDTNPNDNVYTGDIFIVSAFEGGGAHPKMKIYNLIVANNQAGFDFQVITEIDPGVSTTYGNAAVNTEVFPVPTYSRVEIDGVETWQYATSGGSPDYPSTTKIVKVNGQNTTVYAGAFFEGDLNLTALGIEPCFSTFLLSTRNSQSLNASLQDLVTGELNITPPPPTPTGGEICYPNALVLSANCSGIGSSPKWYTAASGGTALGAADGVSADGSTLTIPAGSAAGTYTYYVSCRANGINCESERVAVSGKINPKPTIDGLITNDNTAPFDMVFNAITQLDEVDVVVDEFNLNTNKYKVVNFTATSTGGTNPTTFVWAELNPSNADDITFTYNADGTATFTVNSLTGISDFYDFRVTGTDAKGCSNTDDVRIKIRRSSPPCLVTGPAPCPGTTANYKYDPDNNGVADAIPDGFTAQWTIVAPNTNGAATSGSTTGNSVNVVTQLNCNSQFTIRITLTSTSGLSTKSCELTVNVVDNTPPVITNCPADITIACGASTLPANTGTATATDACGATVTFSDVVVENCSRKAITRTWKAVDPCGNTSTCTQLITVTDAVAPVITCPANRTVALGTALTCGASTLPANTGTATATDACSNASVIVYYKDAPQQNNNVNCANISRTWYAVDASGNVASCVQVIEFAAPIITQANIVKPTDKLTGDQLSKVTGAPVKTSDAAETVGAELNVKAFPNPFNTKVTFVFSSPVSGRATLEVYNIMGQRLGVVYEGFIKAGVVQNVQYNARNLSESNLIYKLRVNDKTAIGKLIQVN
ncbi:T9SS type A sorting domain-containing protein [Lacibacter luteus]|uniref:T9SS type A sorting domain-containing protein n=1 Tax=Lacibacter luteus TaxID=2508719 RepID=A0A4Q1CEV8_9BACT|nr:T9SS type A sorting domain-containing protein [Lacibacter luteus]RXK58128.1 T9SS type A sorting domain-containing protein [Lacibacter luteus]